MRICESFLHVCRLNPEFAFESKGMDSTITRIAPMK